MSDGCTHTTLSAHPGEPVRVGVSFYLDELAWIAVPGIGAGRSVRLSKCASDCSLEIPDRPPTQSLNGPQPPQHNHSAAPAKPSYF